MGVRVLHIAIIACIALTVCAVFGQVVLRYLTYQPVAWTEEFARITFIWLCLLGAGEGARRGSHFVVGLLASRLTGVAATSLALLMYLLQAVLYGIAAYAGAVVLPVVHQQLSITLGMPMSIAYLSIPVGFGLMTLFSLLAAARIVRGLGEQS